MTNSKMTKRALFTSVMALVLCFAMLTGTTFAWFTDQETSANNKIIAGNLDVELWMFNGTDYENIGETGNPIFGAEDSLVAKNDNANTLWEPGKTQIAYLAIRNAGNLALKYNVLVDVVDNGLASALEYAIIPMDAAVTSNVPAVANWEAIKAIAGVTVGELANGRFIAAPNGCLDEIVNGVANETDYFALAIHMKEDAGNEYMTKGAAIDIVVTATQTTAEDDSFDDQYDKDAVFAENTASMQKALDNAIPGTTIQLTAGVDYGTLYLRPSANAGVTKTVDWIGNNYGYESYSLFKDITIIGAEGATVDAIEIEGGTYYNTEHSQADTYPVMLSLIELNNVIIDGVTFTGKGGYDPQGYGNVINLSGNNIKVDGLTLKNCVLENEDNDARLIYKTESTTHLHKYAYDGVEYEFVPSLKNITVTDCTLNGGYIGLELRETENVTITNNEFNVADRNILLPVNTGYTYTGTVTITGNVSNNAKERFVRADGMGDAVVVIKDNTLNNYQGSDADYIKVTNANNCTVDGTKVSVKATGNTEFNNAVTNGMAGVNLTEGAYTMPAVTNKDFAITGTKDTVITVNKPNCGGSDISFNGVTIQGSGYSTGVQHVDTVTYNDVAIKGEMCLYGEKVVFNNCTFELNGQYIWVYSAKEVEFNNCTFNTTGKAILVYNEGAGANKVTVKNCTFNATAGAKAGAIANQNCAAIEIDNYQTSGVGAAHTIITEGNTYGDNFSGEWRIKNFVNGNAITVNGAEYTTIAIDGKTMTIDANKNVTVND